MYKVYLVEYIHDDIYKKLKESFQIVDDKSICDIAISRCINIDKDFIDNAPSLKLIAVHGTGVDSVDLEYAKMKGIMVINAPKQNPLSVAELNVLLMLSLARKIDRCMDDVKKNGAIDYPNTLGLEVSNKTVGFIGIGDISILTARMLKYGFSCNVIGYNRTPKNIDFIKEVSLDTVLSESDFVIMGLALNEKTKDFINLEKLKLMKKDSFIINCCRGALINQDDLLYALQNKIIKGAALDVFPVEPTDINNPLLKENVIPTPHVGGNTLDCLYRVGNTLYEGIVDFVSGRAPKYIVK